MGFDQCAMRNLKNVEKKFEFSLGTISSNWFQIIFYLKSELQSLFYFQSISTMPFIFCMLWLSGIILLQNYQIYLCLIRLIKNYWMLSYFSFLRKKELVIFKLGSIGVNLFGLEWGSIPVSGRPLQWLVTLYQIHFFVYHYQALYLYAKTNHLEWSHM